MAGRWRRWSRVPPGLLTTATIVAVGVASESLWLWKGVDWWLPDLAVGVVFAIAGGLITARDPTSRLGLLVGLTGLTWFLFNFSGAAIAPLAALASRTLLLHRAVLFHAIVSFPDGRVRRSGERLVVGSAYALGLLDIGSADTPALIWSGAALLAFGAMVATRRGPAREAGMRVLPAMILFAVVTGGTSVLFLLSGNVARPQAIVHAYQAGLASVAVVLTVVASRRSRRHALAAATIDLAQGMPGSVRDLLADALRDETLQVAFAVDHEGTTAWVDELGRPTRRLEASATRAVVPIRVGDRIVADIGCDPTVAGDDALRSSIETAARLAARNARLRASLRSEAEALRESQLRLLTAADEQRMALARELERGAGASLQELLTLLNRVPIHASPTVRAAVDRSRDRVEGLGAGLRSLSAGLGPADLATTGLEDALVQLGDAFDGHLDVEVAAPDLPQRLAVAAYFICAEGIVNAIKHAAATEVCVSVRRHDDRLLISIVDDGAGGAAIEAGSGLRGLSDRVAALGGSLAVESAPAKGTRIAVDLPAS